MSLTWYAPSEQLPSDGQQVYARILDWYGEPVQAAYDATSQEFTTILTNVTVPVYQVARWAASDPYPGYPFLQSLFPSTGPMYSVFQLNPEYNRCMRIRRSSDNAEIDITFSAGLLDVSQIETFCSSTNGYVKAWYDQSGYGYHAFQGNTSLQPLIVSAGSVITSNSLPAMSLSLSGQWLETPPIYAGQPLTVFSVTQLNPLYSGGTTYVFLNGSSASGKIASSYHSSGKFAAYNGTALFSIKNFNANQTLLTQLFNGASSAIRVNGSSDVSGNTGSLGLKGTFSIGDRNGSNPFYGYVSEVVLYLSNQSAYYSGMETNINDRFSIY